MELAPRILIVDDETALTEALAMQLRTCGFSVDTAHNGADALALARSRTYDAVVSDILMPIMDGQEFYDKLRGYNPGLCDHFIFMSAYGTMMSQLTRRFVRNKENDLRKPFTLNDLLTSLSKVVPAHRWPKEAVLSAPKPAAEKAAEPKKV